MKEQNYIYISCKDLKKLLEYILEKETKVLSKNILEQPSFVCYVVNAIKYNYFGITKSTLEKNDISRIAKEMAESIINADRSICGTITPQIEDISVKCEDSHKEKSYSIRCNNYVIEDLTYDDAYFLAEKIAKRENEAKVEVYEKNLIDRSIVQYVLVGVMQTVIHYKPQEPDDRIVVDKLRTND